MVGPRLAVVGPMHDDIAVDAAFRALGLDWRSASVQDIVDAGHSGYRGGALPNSDFNGLARVAARFAYARRCDELIEAGQIYDDDLIPAEHPDPPEAWETVPTRCPQPRLRWAEALLSVISWPVRMWRRRPSA